MTGTTWYRIRIALIVAAFATTLFARLFVPFEQIEEMKLFSPFQFVVMGVVALIGVLLMPLMVLFVVGIQAVNPASDPKWALPTHQSNPFRLSNPLLGFHFAAFVFLACGIALIFSSLWNGWFAIAEGVFTIVGAIMMLIGIRLCVRVFKHKIRNYAQSKAWLTDSPNHGP